MTFVIAKITDRDRGAVSLLSDTKLTDRHDITRDRQTLTHPSQKLVIIDDDVAVGIAGDTPKSALEQLVSLRGQTVDAIERFLQAYTGETSELGVSKKFLVVSRVPSPRIVVIGNGQLEERTDVGTGWIGDHEAFETYSRIYQSEDLLKMPETQRFMMSMVNLVAMEDVDSVGGYMVRVSGRSDKPMRFGVDAGFVLPDYLEATITSQPGSRSGVQFRLPEGADATRHQRFTVPGAEPTYSALAHYIPESGSAWLHTHEEPWQDAARMHVGSLAELVAAAREDHNQALDPSATEYAMTKYGW